MMETICYKRERDGLLLESLVTIFFCLNTYRATHRKSLPIKTHKVYSCAYMLTCIWHKYGGEKWFGMIFLVSVQRAVRSPQARHLQRTRTTWDLFASWYKANARIIKIYLRDMRKTAQNVLAPYYSVIAILLL